MKTSRCSRLASLLLALMLTSVSEVSAFSIDTHRLVNRRAADASTLNTYLQQQLGFANGLAERFSNRGVRQWIEEGGAAEDQFFNIELLGAAFRSRHHFHNPLLPWDQAGLNALSVCPPFVLRGEASVRWAQHPNQGVSGKAAWGDARQAVFDALTLATKADRDSAWVRTFQILGQQIHLVADLAVPAHTRNNPHCPTPDSFEAWASRPDNDALLRDLLASPSTPPDPAIFSLGVPHPDPIARVPIARLWDSDQYDGSNPAVTLSPTTGLAEYTNANFFSDDTVFGKTFPFPAPTSVELGFPEREPKIGELRRYFRKIRDGELVDHLAVPSALHAFLPDALKDRKKGLDDNVLRDYARKLLPRAVGYSAALLDYFFRGKLEPSFTADQSDPTRSLLTVVNRSPEPLGPGTLTVYTDNAAGARQPVAGGTLQLAASVGPDTPLPPLAVDPALEVTPLTLVYRGVLGQEADAVIGKVQGGAEVEEIFRGASDWMLRTADGIFPLGLGTEPGQVKWGDVDNTLVARTFLPGNDQRFQAYRINRPEGSRTVPLKPDPVDPNSKVVDLVPIGEPVTLSGPPIDLGTTVSLTRIVDYAQHLATVEVDYFYRFDQISQSWIFDSKNPRGGFAETAHTETLSRSATFRLAMPLAFPSEYAWGIQDFSLNRNGDILALVSLSLTSPPIVFVPIRRHNSQGIITTDPQSISPAISFNTPEPPFFFVVNLSRRAVLAKSCEDTVTITFRDFQETFVADLHSLHHRDTVEERWDPLDVFGGGFSGEPTLADVTVRGGLAQWTNPGLYRRELTTAGFWTGVGLASVDVISTGPVVLRDPFLSPVQSLKAAITLTNVFQTVPAPGPMIISDIRRSNGPEEGYTLLGRKAVFEFNFEEWTPFQWTPQRTTVRALAGLSLPTTVNSIVFPLSVNRTSALFRVLVFFPRSARQRLTHLVTERQEFVFSGLSGDTVAVQYRLLEPNLVFNVTDLRFHRLSSTLEALAAPRPLAPGGSSSGEYHVVGRP